MRLQIDNAVWERILDRRNGEDDLRRSIGASIEEKLILPNHDEIVKIMQSNIHLAVPDPKFFQIMLQYIRHLRFSKNMSTIPTNVRERIVKIKMLLFPGCCQ